MHAWFAVFSNIHSRILLTECASESLYSVQNIAIHRIRLIFDSSNTLVYRLGTNVHNVHNNVLIQRFGARLDNCFVEHMATLATELLAVALLRFRTFANNRVELSVWPHLRLARNRNNADSVLQSAKNHFATMIRFAFFPTDLPITHERRRFWKPNGHAKKYDQC